MLQATARAPPAAAPLLSASRLGDRIRANAPPDGETSEALPQ